MMAKRTAEGTVILRASLVALLSAAWPAGAVLLELPASGTKCVSEEIHANVLVVAVYTVVHHADSPTISSKVELQQNCINLNRRIGLAAKDWDSVARKEKLEGVELELKKLEELVKAIHENLLHLKNREADMRDMSEITNSRVAWFSIMSLGVCLTASVLQLWHLKGFFQKKKLI